MSCFNIGWVGFNIVSAPLPLLLTLKDKEKKKKEIAYCQSGVGWMYSSLELRKDYIMIPRSLSALKTYIT